MDEPEPTLHSLQDREFIAWAGGLHSQNPLFFQDLAEQSTARLQQCVEHRARQIATHVRLWAEGITSGKASKAFHWTKQDSLLAKPTETISDSRGEFETPEAAMQQRRSEWEPRWRRDAAEGS